MKVGIIMKLNQKGQIVIPNNIRKSLGIKPTTPLHVIQRGQGIYLYPIKEVVEESQNEESYPALLKRTQGTWQENWKSLRERRGKIELESSRRRKQVW